MVYNVLCEFKIYEKMIFLVYKQIEEFLKILMTYQMGSSHFASKRQVITQYVANKAIMFILAKVFPNLRVFIEFEVCLSYCRHGTGLNLHSAYARAFLSHAFIAIFFTLFSFFSRKCAVMASAKFSI